MKSLQNHIFILAASTFVWGCASGGSKKSERSSLKSSSSSSSSKRRTSDSRNEISVSGSFKSFTNSLSNNSESTMKADRSKARSLAAKLERQVKVAKKIQASDILALMSAKRLSGGDSRSVMTAAKRLVGQEMKKNINQKLPEMGQLEIALAAFQAKQYGMAEYFIIQLRDSKSPPIKSATLNLEGLMEYRFGTYRQATDLWLEAIKIDSSNYAARVNVALTALDHGDYKTASRFFAGIDQDWFVLGNAAVAEKLALKGGRAKSLCDRALKSESRRRSLLFNCALADFQVSKDYKSAMDKLKKANSLSGGGARLSDKIVKAIRVVRSKMAESNAKPKGK